MQEGPRTSLVMNVTASGNAPSRLAVTAPITALTANPATKPATVGDEFTAAGAPTPEIVAAGELPKAVSNDALNEVNALRAQANAGGAAGGNVKGGKGHDTLDHVNHALHITHEAHLAAEGAEGAAHVAGHASKYMKSIETARQVVQGHSQGATDLRKMAGGITKLENAVANGAGPKAATKLAEAKKAYDAAKVAQDANKPAAAAANALVQEHALAKNIPGHARKVSIGQKAMAFEKALAGSSMGRGLMATGRVVSSPAMVKGLTVVGAGLEAYGGFIDSNAKTTGGKALNAALAGGGGALVMANPLVAIGDLATPKGYKVSEVYRGGAGAISSIAEGMVTGDTRAMNDFHTRSMNGDYGKIMQASSEAGEYWAKHGVGGGLAKAWDALKWQFSR